MNNRHLIIAIAWVLALSMPSAWAGSPTVSNVRATQKAQTQLVDIFYDLSATNSGPFSVSVAVSTNNGATYDLNATSFTGSGIGSAVTPGTRKQVLWDAGADWPGQYSSAVRFKVSAEEKMTPSGMVLIPAGTNSGTDPDFGAYSLTNVTAFYMDAMEVTKAKWDEVYTWAVTNGYSFSNSGSGKAANHPVHFVNWYDCAKWCNARSQKEGKTPCYTVGGNVYKTEESVPACNFAANGYRLPTNTEWEYAARGGLSSKRFPWGDTITHSQANYYSSSLDNYNVSPTQGYHPTYATDGDPYTSPAGVFSSNGYGLYDMAGNIWEWCDDTSGPGKSIRGGSWNYDAYGARCGISYRSVPGSDSDMYGFRAVCR